MREPITFTVSELNDYVKALIDSSEVLSNVAVVGEISNFNNHYKTGHFYFTLKDENALVKAVMFRSYSSQVKFEPDNNMKVLCVGRVSVFPRDGVYQLYEINILGSCINAKTIPSFFKLPKDNSSIFLDSSNFNNLTNSFLLLLIFLL